MDTITPQELKERLDRGDPLVLVDVRQDWELQICRIEGSINIPIEEIEERASELDPANEIVVYCHHGMRSAAVAGYLGHLGFEKVKNLTGGIAQWGQTVDPAMRQY
jgi:adenylyltransferase/sulfurtransferase